MYWLHSINLDHLIGILALGSENIKSIYIGTFILDLVLNDILEYFKLFNKVLFKYVRANHKF